MKSITSLSALLIAAAFISNAAASEATSPRAAAAGGSATPMRMLRAELDLAAPVEAVWKAWTTNEGIASFFAPRGIVQLQVDGSYDVWFDPDGKPGERGAEGMRILAVEPNRRFAFTWNAPPSIPTIRGQRTMVVLDFEPRDAGKTHLTFTHLGWGDGSDWDEAYTYFDRAWAAVVLPRLVHRFAVAPIDWKAVPELQPIAASIATTFTVARR